MENKTSTRFFLARFTGLHMWHDIVVASCLVLVLEGIMPFISPASWRQTMMTAAALNDSTLRRIGLVSMLAGTALLYLVN